VTEKFPFDWPPAGNSPLLNVKHCNIYEKNRFKREQILREFAIAKISQPKEYSQQWEKIVYWPPSFL
jgi:hypothetical protein